MKRSRQPGSFSGQLRACQDQKYVILIFISSKFIYKLIFTDAIYAIRPVQSRHVGKNLADNGK